MHVEVPMEVQEQTRMRIDKEKTCEREKKAGRATMADSEKEGTPGSRELPDNFSGASPRNL